MATSTARKKEINMVDQIERLLHHNKRAVAYFYLPDCPYCQYIEPFVQELQKQYADAITFNAIDITDNAWLLEDKYGVQSVPTVIYFLHGQPVARHGSRNKTITYEDMEHVLRDVFGYEE